jgi:predicted RNA-binding Zn-ribbon protein involved in translation (DUF1610 family)
MSEENNEDLLVADRWMTPQHECPHCGEVQEDDSCVDEEYDCVKCGKRYILGEC